VSMNVTVLAQAQSYDWLYVAAIGLMAALISVLNTFFRDRY
jgi:hypothetical protein